MLPTDTLERTREDFTFKGVQTLQLYSSKNGLDVDNIQVMRKHITSAFRP